MRRIIIFYSCIILLNIIPYYSASAKELTIAADEWCPINCKPDSAKPGIGIELAVKIFEPLGYKVKYIVMPWSKALAKVRKGKIDAVIGANRWDDPSLIFPQTPIYNVTDALYTTADNTTINFNGLDSLDGLHIGIITDYGYSQEIQRFIKKQRTQAGSVQEVSGDEALERNILKLLAHRIDILIEAKPVMEYLIQQKNLSAKIKYIGEVPQGNVYLAFSPANKDSKLLAQIFDKGMIRQQLKLPELFSTYGLQP